MKTSTRSLLVSLALSGLVLPACGGAPDAKVPAAGDIPGAGTPASPASSGAAATSTPASPATDTPAATTTSGSSTTSSGSASADAPKSGDASGSAPAGASLGDKQKWDEMTKEIDDKAAKASTTCGTTIKASFDTASFKGVDPMKESPLAMCRDVLNTLTTICAKDPGKASVKKNVDTVICRKAGDGTKVTRETKQVVVHIDSKNTAITGKKKGSYSWKSALEEIL